MGHFRKIKRLIHQGDLTVLNINAPHIVLKTNEAKWTK
jgi:hypothetical protein